MHDEERSGKLLCLFECGAVIIPFVKSESCVGDNLDARHLMKRICPFWEYSFECA